MNIIFKLSPCIARYSCSEPGDQSGEYVLASDLAAARAEIAAKDAEIARHWSKIEHLRLAVNRVEARAERAEAERDALKKLSKYGDHTIAVYVETTKQLRAEVERWEQVWTALNEMGAELGDANKPLAVTASWTLMKREVERLMTWVNDLQSGMYINCVYCGHRYGPRENTPTSMADVLKAHVEQCPKHPMSALKAEVERLREENAAMRGELRETAQIWSRAEYRVISPPVQVFAIPILDSYKLDTLARKHAGEVEG